MAKEEDLEKDEQGEEEGSEEESSDASSSDESEAAEKDETAEEKADEQGEESQDDAEEEKVEAKEESDEGNDEEETEQDEAKEEEEGETWTPPTQLGHKRFVYAAYLAGGIVIAFVATKIVDLAWTRLGQWKPDFGEPRDEIVAPLAAVIGALVALRYWRDRRSASSRRRWPRSSPRSRGRAARRSRTRRPW